MSRQPFRSQDSSTGEQSLLLQEGWEKQTGLHEILWDHSCTPSCSCVPEPGVTLSLPLFPYTGQDPHQAEAFASSWNKNAGGKQQQAPPAWVILQKKRATSPPGCAQNSLSANVLSLL